MSIDDGRVGEIIESGTTQFLAECYELHCAPAFGSLVRASDGPVDVFGVVCNVQTGGLDPGRRPIARGRDALDQATLYRDNPHLPKLLRTEFQAFIVGHAVAGAVYPYLPERPPRVHGFVYGCSDETVARFTDEPSFLSLLVGARIDGPVDELIAAVVRHAKRAHDDDPEYRLRAGKELAVLLADDLHRLTSVLRRI